MPQKEAATPPPSRWRRRLDRFRGLTPRRQASLLLNRIERSLGKSRLWSPPQRLDIVPTHRCNLRCVGCVRYEGEGPKDLDLDFFREILEESAGWVIDYKFCSIGEPFLNQKLPEMLRLAAERGCNCTIVTNGGSLTYVPEPTSLAMLALASAAICVRRWRR